MVIECDYRWKIDTTHSVAHSKVRKKIRLDTCFVRKINEVQKGKRMNTPASFVCDA